MQDCRTVLFNSYTFLLLFLPVTLAGYFLLGRRRAFFAAAWLTAASLVFYGWWDWRFVPLLVASIAGNYGMGMAIARAGRRARTGLFALAVAANLILLAYFKYANMLVATLDGIGGTHIGALDIVLPLGISFFTFTQIAYLADVYQHKAREARPIHYALFVTYFPHLIAGPILHHKEMMPQFAEARTYVPQPNCLLLGAVIFTLGLAKKVLIADNIAPYASAVFNDPGHPSLLVAWGGVLAYAFQIYFDFSGYSDMAIGLSRLFGIRLPLNFDSPYKSRNIIEFWRRWHMTLSRFLRDYLYIPLGGNRHGGVRRYANLMITMLLGGLWHGAGWNFAIWGGLHGLYLAINHAWQYLRGETRAESRWTRAASVALTFAAVNVAWVFFRAPDFGTGRDILLGMFGAFGIAVPEAFAAQLRGLGPLLEGAGIGVFLGGGHQFMMTYAWIAFAGALAFGAPNTQQLTARFRPALNAVKVPPAAAWLRLRLNWQWATALGLLGAATLLSLSRPTEFLYFQF
jgi:D-alanyl-lipoteichoic acid acyltransferase DltB (MBOAT superfamily)